MSTVARSLDFSHREGDRIVDSRVFSRLFAQKKITNERQIRYLSGSDEGVAPFQDNPYGYFSTLIRRYALMPNFIATGSRFLLLMHR